MSIIRRKVPKNNPLYSSIDEVIKILRGQCHNRFCHKIDECPEKHLICKPFLNDTTAIYWVAAKELEECAYAIRVKGEEWCEQALKYRVGKLNTILDIIRMHHSGRVVKHILYAIECVHHFLNSFRGGKHQKGSAKNV